MGLEQTIMFLRGREKGLGVGVVILSGSKFRVFKENELVER